MSRLTTFAEIRERAADARRVAELGVLGFVEALEADREARGITDEEFARRIKWLRAFAEGGAA